MHLILLGIRNEWLLVEMFNYYVIDKVVSDTWIPFNKSYQLNIKPFIYNAFCLVILPLTERNEYFHITKLLCKMLSVIQLDFNIQLSIISFKLIEQDNFCDIKDKLFHNISLLQPQSILQFGNNQLGINCLSPFFIQITHPKDLLSDKQKVIAYKKLLILKEYIYNYV